MSFIIHVLQYNLLQFHLMPLLTLPFFDVACTDIYLYLVHPLKYMPALQIKIIELKVNIPFKNKSIIVRRCLYVCGTHQTRITRI